MNTTNWLLLAGAITVAGKWSRGEDISPKTVIAIVFLALFVAVMGEVDEDLASAFAALILVAVLLANGDDIIKRLNPDKIGVVGGDKPGSASRGKGDAK